MLRQTCFAFFMASALLGCGKGANTATQTASATGPLLISPEDVMTLESGTLASGPVITGTILPERRADLRAEVSSVVLQVLKENGDAVKQGDILVRLDETSIRDSLNSAEEAARAATQTLEQAERQLQRLKTLRASGMTSTQSLDDAEGRRNNAQSDVVASKTRVVQARQQLQHTTVRAPFAGVVSDRKASAGDTATIGKELLKVVDPTSLRFEGRVSADTVGDLKVGQEVAFRINGYGRQNFRGKVRRIDPSANPVTRQVEVLVDFLDKDLPRVAGLYAEGNVAAQTRKSLTLPEAVLVRNGDKTVVWRVDGDALRKTEVVLGNRDPQRGEFEVLKGLKNGDKVIRAPQITFKDGDKFKFTPSARILSNVSASATADTAATAGAAKSGSNAAREN
jgi:RND family efflux transporter MFP subunit